MRPEARVIAPPAQAATPCAPGYSCAQRGALATRLAKSFLRQRPQNRPGTSLCRPRPFFDTALRYTKPRNLPVPVRCQTSTPRTNTWLLQLSHDCVPMLRLNKRSHRLSTSCDSTERFWSLRLGYRPRPPLAIKRRFVAGSYYKL